MEDKTMKIICHGKSDFWSSENDERRLPTPTRRRSIMRIRPKKMPIVTACDVSMAA